MAFLNLSTYGDIPVELDGGSCVMEPIEIGGRRRAYSGVQLSAIRKRLRRWRVRLIRVPRLTGDLIVEALNSASAIGCSGDLIDPYTASVTWCNATISSVQHPKHADGEYQLIEFMLEEAEEASGLLLFATDGDAPGSYEFERNSPATYRDADGFLRTAAADELRCPHYHDLDGDGVAELATTLLENESTNRFLRSNDITHGAWVKTGCTVPTPNTVIGPDGELSLDEIVENGANSQHGIGQDATGLAGGPIAITAIVNPGPRTIWRLEIHETADPSNYVRAWFDTVTALATSTDAGGAGNLGSVSVERYGETFRLHLVGGLGAVTAVTGLLCPATADGVLTYAGSSAAAGGAGCMQIEDAPGGLASSYIETIAAIATRLRDQVSWAWPHDPIAVAIYLKAIIPGAVVDSYIEISDETRSGAHLLISSLSDFIATHHNGSSSVTRSSSGVIQQPGLVAEILLQAYPTGALQLHTCMNGGAISSTALSGTLPLAEAWPTGTRVRVHNSLANPNGPLMVISGRIARGPQTFGTLRTLARARPNALVA